VSQHKGWTKKVKKEKMVKKEDSAFFALMNTERRKRLSKKYPQLVGGRTRTFETQKGGKQARSRCLHPSEANMNVGTRMRRKG